MPSLKCQPSPTSRELINCFDAAAFALPAQFTFGNASRNLLRGPNMVNTDLSMMKRIRLRGTVQLEVRAEMFNAFNRVNYGNPGASFGAGSFARISSAGSMRQVQLGGRLIF